MTRIFMAMLATGLLATGCAHHAVYTIASVKSQIDESIQDAYKYRRTGKLAKASDILLAQDKRVLKEYPKSVLTYKTVKKLLKASIKIGNLCLDYGEELLQDAVSNKMWALSTAYKKRHAKHQKMNGKLRALLPSLPKTTVSAAKPAATAVPAAPAAGAATTSATGMATPPAGGVTPAASPASEARPAESSGGSSNPVMP
ncbi:MAG: hypothetical protein J7M25_16375 [Deltaproteobacteria bacterium]|nr:hypothetical protein [Deltaproteobacteria bacterium]